MIITVDGYDGTGKTTLAKKLAEKYGFIYLDKPLIKMIQVRKNISYEEAVEYVKELEHKLFSAKYTTKQIAKVYLHNLLWLKEYQKTHNVILDRGLLTIYAVVGNSETEQVFKEFLQKGVGFNGAIYLTASDEERYRRKFAADPNDPDLKYDKKWRENNLEEFAKDNSINFLKIATDGKTREEIFEEAIKYVDQQIVKQKDIEK